MTLTVRVVAIGLWLVVGILVPEAVVSWAMHAAEQRAAAAQTFRRNLSRGAEPGLPLLPGDPARSDQDAPAQLDLRGNEIVRPVARYRVDRRGTLYEVHSPDTEVPRLAAPTL